jgi:tRNA threonylcarbamoyladenosine biosynthesis protein TsaB
VVPPVNGEGWVGAGSGFMVHGLTLAARYGHLISAQPEPHPHAQDIAVLGADMRAGLALPAEQAHPVYLRSRGLYRG